MKDLNDSYVRTIAPRKDLEDVEFCLKEKQEKIDRLKKLIKGKKDTVAARTKYRDNLKRENDEKRKDKLPVYQSNVNQMEYRVSDKRVQNQIIRKDHKKLLAEIKETVCRDIKQLTDYIFPIKEIVLKPDHFQVSLLTYVKLCNEKMLNFFNFSGTNTNPTP